MDAHRGDDVSRLCKSLVRTIHEGFEELLTPGDIVLALEMVKLKYVTQTDKHLNWGKDRYDAT